MEFIKIIFGEYSFQAYAASIFISLMGYMIWFLVNYLKSDKPSKWSWDVWNADKNFFYILLLIICSWVLLRWQEDALVGINKVSGDNLAFIKDGWFWFLIGGALFRIAVHYLHKFYKKKETN